MPPIWPRLTYSAIIKKYSDTKKIDKPDLQNLLSEQVAGIHGVVMPNHVISNAFAIFRCKDTNKITQIEWSAGHICSGAEAQGHKPQEVVYLNESFGEDTSQVLNFAFMDDEFALYADTDAKTKAEIYEFLNNHGEVVILAEAPRPGYATEFDVVRWTVEVAAYESYTNMVEHLAKLGSVAAATHQAM